MALVQNKVDLIDEAQMTVWVGDQLILDLLDESILVLYYARYITLDHEHDQFNGSLIL